MGGKTGLVSSDGLTEKEFRILVESKKKSLDEIAVALGLSEAEASQLLESANRKLVTAEARGSSIMELLPKPTVFRLQKNIGAPQQGSMKVGSQILEILSKGVYSAPWNSLKELVSNAYDASATRVDIEYFPNEQKLVVKDDGLGMDYNDFDQNFTFITRSLKRTEAEHSKLHDRPLIGKIGIGVVAASELCETMRIISAKMGADTYFEALIDFARIRGIESKDKEFYEVSQFTLTNHEKKDIGEHYTRIELLNLKRTFVNILNNLVPPGETRFEPGTESFDEIVRKLCSGNYGSIRREAGPLWEFLINFANVIPIEYLENGPISIPKKTEIPEEYAVGFENALKTIDSLKERMRKYDFKVFFNYMELRKPVIFPNESYLIKYGKDFCVFPIADRIPVTDPITKKVTEIALMGYFYYQRTRIVPEELRGMVVRIRNVSIGGPDKDLWGYPYPGDKLYFPQVYGEVYVDEGLEEAMNIDRSTFKTSHHEYATIREALHAFLKEKLFHTARDMYFDRRGEKAGKMEKIRQGTRALTVAQEFGKDYTTEEVRRYTSEPVLINPANRKIFVNILSDAYQGFKKNDRFLLQDVSLALEMAFTKEKEPAKIRQEFWRILRELTQYRRS